MVNNYPLSHCAELRLRMANTSMHTIASFSWEDSFRKFESLLTL